MLLDDNVVSNREPKAGSLAGRFRRKEWIEDLLSQLSGNTQPIITDPNFDAVSKISGCGKKSRLIVTSLSLLALDCCVKAIRDKIEKRPRYLSREQINLPDAGVKRLFQFDGETSRLGSFAVVGTVQAFIHESIDVAQSMLPGTLTRMKQHALDDRVGTLAVLHDFLKVAAQHVGQLFDLSVRFPV